MPRPANVTHVVVAGHLGGGEVFNAGFWLAGAAPVNDAAANTLATAIAAAMETSGAQDAVLSLMSADCGIDHLRVYGYATAGGPATAVGEASFTGSTTGEGSGSGPLQVCLVSSLLTGVASRSGRGRIYWPVTATVVFANHLVDNAHVTDLANKLVLWFTAINLLAPPNIVSVVSPTHSVVNRVTSVRVDDRADIQRRHANQQVALFTQVAVL